MRLSRLAALPLIVLLSGCPSLFGATGNNALNPRLLAVTENKGAGAVANAYLEWQPVTNATRYQVTRTLGSNSDKLPKSDKLTFSEPVGFEAITYKVVAFDAADNEKTASAALTVSVLAAEVGAPTLTQVGGKNAASDGNITAVDTGKPALAWSTVSNATHYYVRVYNSDDKTIYAAFTKDPQATVGSLAWDDIKVPNYPQVKDQVLPVGKPVNVTIAAIRANDADLKVATAFDIKTSAVGKVMRD